MAIQNFGLGFNVKDLNLDDILWLYDHSQNHKNIYSVSIAVNYSGDLLQFKEAKKFTAIFKFNEWSPDTTKCVDELIKRFKLGD